MTDNLIYFYTKTRAQFGRPCRFSISKAILNVHIEPCSESPKNFIAKDPVDIGTQYAPEYSNHDANTDPFDLCKKAVQHAEGGWPKDVNYQDIDQITRFRKKQEKDEQYTLAVTQLAQEMEHRVKQNNAIDIYDSYFNKERKPTRGPPQISATSIMKLSSSDCSWIGAATVNKISWSPFTKSKIVAAYGSTQFQTKLVPACKSHVWNLEYPRTPETTLTPGSSLTSVQYNPRDHFSIAGGCLNGQVVVWDTRKGQLPAYECDPMHRHLDAVWDSIWITSKASTELFTASTGGEIKWWDTRKMQEPYEILIMDITGENSIGKAQGIYSLAYDANLPTRFIAGTEFGQVLVGNRKGKSILEKVGTVYSGHFGPVMSVQRNPGHLKCFLSIGNYRARIWSEEIKECELLSTPLSKYEYTGGCWSPVRPSVMYTINKHGEIEAWDFIYKHDVPVLSAQITNGYSLTSLLVHEEGEFILVGDFTGTINLLTVSDGFFKTHREEKSSLTNLLEIEKRREKILELRIKEILQRAISKESKQEQKAATAILGTEADHADEKRKELSPVEAAEQDFFNYINEYKAERERKRIEFEKEQRKKKHNDSSSNSDSTE